MSVFKDTEHVFVLKNMARFVTKILCIRAGEVDLCLLIFMR